VPEPYAGLVIRYAYLWKREFDAGRDEGMKDRPCAIVMTLIDEDGDKDVLVLPITHSPPANAADAIEIPSLPRTDSISTQSDPGSSSRRRMSSYGLARICGLSPAATHPRLSMVSCHLDSLAMCATDFLSAIDARSLSASSAPSDAPTRSRRKGHYPMHNDGAFGKMRLYLAGRQ
jgi:hypothetical protein